MQARARGKPFIRQLVEAAGMFSLPHIKTSKLHPCTMFWLYAAKLWCLPKRAHTQTMHASAALARTQPAASLITTPPLSFPYPNRAHLAHEAVAVLGERHHRRRRAAALSVGDDGGLAALHGGDGAVGRAQVDADDLLFWERARCWNGWLTALDGLIADNDALSWLVSAAHKDHSGGCWRLRPTTTNSSNSHLLSPDRHSATAAALGDRRAAASCTAGRRGAGLLLVELHGFVCAFAALLLLVLGFVVWCELNG
jgi:hypothetical protein